MPLRSVSHAVAVREEPRLSIQFARAAAGQGPAKSVHASQCGPQVEACRNDCETVDRTPRLVATRNRVQRVPPLKLSVIMAVYNEQDTIV